VGLLALEVVLCILVAGWGYILGQMGSFLVGCNSLENTPPEEVEGSTSLGGDNLEAFLWVENNT
jgi:hypothetical protein